MDLIELAKAGHHREAMESAVAEAFAKSGDVNAHHRAGAVFALCGDNDKALDYLHAALRIRPNFHFTEMEIAGVHASRREWENALKWYEKARKSAPEYVLAYRRTAEILRHLGRHDDARIALQQGRALEPANPELVSELVDVLCFQHKRDEAWPVYDAVIHAGKMRDSDYIRRLTLLTECGLFNQVRNERAALGDKITGSLAFHGDMLSCHAKLAQSVDRSAIISAAQTREASDRWLTTEQLMLTLKAAIASNRPTSFVRVGDGEARFLAYCDPALRLRLTASEAETLGEVPFWNWFGKSVSNVAHSDVIRLQADVLVAFEDADILGIPSAARLEKDYMHFGYLGAIEALIESIRASGRNLHITNSMAHIEINRRSAFYRDLLHGLDFVGVVSPHPGLAERLARECGISSWTEYIIAGEGRLPAHVLWRGPVPHFPDRYRELQNELKVPQRGAVFLVAAGLLGKVYCDWLKKRGGIGIDVGSIVDAWMGYDTRPGQFADLASLALPA